MLLVTYRTRVSIRLEITRCLTTDEDNGDATTVRNRKGGEPRCQ